MGALVRCCICDKQWNALQANVLYRSADHRWWCASERECKKRRIVLLARMQLALDASWRVLDAYAERAS